MRPAAALPTELLDRLRQHKTDLLLLLPDAAGKELAGPWRVVVESCRPRQGSVAIDAITTTTSPGGCIEHTLIALERAVMHKNAGRETAFPDLIDNYLRHLTACGCQVRVELVS